MRHCRGDAGVPAARRLTNRKVARSARCWGRPDSLDIVLMVGLTGGIGAGKSSVTSRLASLGAVVIDADRIAHEVVEPGTDGLAEIVATFGRGVLREDGSLNRPVLGEVVFGDEAARRRLEEIIHPRVRARTTQLTAAAAADAVVVNDVPLLVEAGLAATYHLVVVVSAATQTRIERLRRSRGMAEEQAHQRIQAQASDEQRRQAADVVLENDGDFAALYAAVDGLWRDRLVPYERNVRQHRPAWPGPRVILAGPDPDWSVQFTRLAARIRHAIGGDAPVEHIGLTAVPGLPAEDVIDIQVGVASLAEADTFADRLTAAGFPRALSADWDSSGIVGQGGAQETERRYGGADPGRPVNLYLRVTGSPVWRSALLVRDHLRSDGRERAGFAALQQALAEETPDRDAYAEGLRPWLATEYPRAEQWATATGWHA
ncbi:MAG TPA: dephospho-CoA kinase [Micromonosporaceae bacterium]|nr:dephospho-CoA kinase [Micromonosporaceae bacterium]